MTQNAVLPEFPRFISYGHRAMYLGPAAIMGHQPSSVIDIACGDGFGYHALMSHNAIESYWGIDSSPTEIQKGRRLLVNPNHVMVSGDWLTYPEDSLVPADFVFCIEVLEHVPPHVRYEFVDKCARFAKKNLFLSTPPADRNDHGELTIPECRDLLRSVVNDVSVIDIQWTTLYVCKGTA